MAVRVQAGKLFSDYRAATIMKIVKQTLNCSECMNVYLLYSNTLQIQTNWRGTQHVWISSSSDYFKISVTIIIQSIPSTLGTV